MLFSIDQLRPVRLLGYHAGTAVDGAQVCITVFERRRANADEDSVAEPYGFSYITGKLKPAVLRISRNDFVEMRLIDGEVALPQGLNLAQVVVGTRHLMADLGETSSSDQTDITTPEN